MRPAYARRVSSPSLPMSARFALWFSGWACGALSLDDTRDAIVGDDAAHDVTGVPGSPGSHPLIVAVGLLRGRGATGAGVALPVPGDPLGLAGPAAFNAEVVEAREGVVVEGADLGLVPHRTGAGVVWTCHPAVTRRQVPDVAEADQALRQALVAATATLARMDVARWRPEVADELMALRRDVDLPVPATMVPRAVRLAGLAARCRTIVDLALEDDGGSITGAEAGARRAALLPLDGAARRGLVAACSASSVRPSRTG
jgi:hypothetical protein